MTAAPALTLLRLPDGRRHALGAGAKVVLGRSAACDVVVADARVSGRHARLSDLGGVPRCWLLEDLRSRHGVTVNGVAVPLGDAVTVSAGDAIGLGPVLVGLEAPEPETRGNTLSTLDGATSRPWKQARVDLSPEQLTAIARLASARTVARVQEELIRCATTLTDCRRAAVLLATDESGAMLTVQREAARSSVVQSHLSRSLARTALATGAATSLPDDAQRPGSISSGDVGAACCIRLGGADSRLLFYADTDRAATFTPAEQAVLGALAEVAGSAITRLAAEDIDARRALLQRDLDGARQVQHMLSPPGSGSLMGERLSFGLTSLPGRILSGDLVDAFDLPDGRAAVLVGDVMGKGAPAAFLMASLQARVRQGLMDGVPPDTLLTTVNRGLCTSVKSTLVSLWLGVMEHDGAGARCRYVNAGHGLALLRSEGDHVETLEEEGGPLLGVDADAIYTASERPLLPGATLLMVTDGVTEQIDPEGFEFGMDRARTWLAGAAPADLVPSILVDAVQRFAAGTPQRDDMTVLLSRWN